LDTLILQSNIKLKRNKNKIEEKINEMVFRFELILEKREFHRTIFFLLYFFFSRQQQNTITRFLFGIDVVVIVRNQGRKRESKK
jgi:hypothetical protein